MFKPRQLVRSNATQVIYLIIHDYGFALKAMVIKSHNIDVAGRVINITGGIDGEVIGNNFEFRSKK